MNLTSSKYISVTSICIPINPDDWNGMNEEYAFEEDAGGVLSVPGTGIAYQTWSYGSWSNVYEYKGKYFIE